MGVDGTSGHGDDHDEDIDRTLSPLRSATPPLTPLATTLGKGIARSPSLSGICSRVPSPDPARRGGQMLGRDAREDAAFVATLRICDAGILLSEWIGDRPGGRRRPPGMVPAIHGNCATSRSFAKNGGPRRGRGRPTRTAGNPCRCGKRRGTPGSVVRDRQLLRSPELHPGVAARHRIWLSVGVRGTARLWRPPRVWVRTTRRSGRTRRGRSVRTSGSSPARARSARRGCRSPRAACRPEGCRRTRAGAAPGRWCSAR